MDIQEQIKITEELLEGVKELNGEYQEGWENVIENAEKLIKQLKQVKNNDLLHNVVGRSEWLVCDDKELDCPYYFTSRCTIGRCDCKPKANLLPTTPV